MIAPRPAIRLMLLTVVLMLSACTFPPIDFPSNEQALLQLAPGDTKSIDFFTVSTDIDSGILLNGGSRYSLQFVTLSHWNDGPIGENELGQALDERGFANSLMAFDFLGTARRSRQHRWFELMLYQPRCKAESLRGITELEMDESSGSYQFVAACDGALSLFVNDSYGFYDNNTGYANIALSRMD